MRRSAKWRLVTRFLPAPPYSSNVTIAVRRPRGVRRLQQRPLLVLRERSRRRLRERLALHARRPEPEKPVEVIDRREREVHRRGLPAPLALQPPLEVSGGVVARPRILERRLAARPLAQPRAIRRDMLRVCVARARRQRRPLQIPRVALKRRGDRVAAVAGLLVDAAFLGCGPATTRLVDDPPDGTVF
jgi:hypothetical protein